MHQISIIINLLVIISTISHLAAADKDIIRNKNYQSDIPNEQDLRTYLSSIDRNVRSLYGFNKGDSFKLNIIFGLFLMNVNLKHAMDKGGERLSAKVRVFAKDIVWYSEKIITFYHVLSKVFTNSENSVYRRVATLFTDDTMWLKKIKKFHVAPPLRNISSNFARRWESSDHYVNKTLSYLENEGQKPTASDACLASIAENKNGDFTNNPVCLITRECYENIVGGTDYGYYLAHRIVQLVVANIGLGCSIISPKEDAILMETMCTQAYYESIYIAKNGYKNADLLLEFIALCSMSGQSQFIRFSWLERLLKLQTPYGWFEIPCAIRNLVKNGYKRTKESITPKLELYSYPEVIRNKKNVTEVKNKNVDSASAALIEQSRVILQMQKNKEEIRDIMHESAVAAAAFAAAVRYIVEMYYH